MKIVSRLLVILLLFIPLLAFSKGAEESQKEPASGELVFWHPYSGSRIESLTASARKFEAANPGWKVKLEKIGYGDDMRNKWVTGLASKTLPDLFGATLDQAVAMYDAGAAVSADRAIQVLGGESAFLKKPLETLSYRGQYIAVPHYGHSKILYYRHDLLKKAGLSVPVTVEEFVQAAEKLTVPAEERYGFVVPLSKEGNLSVDFLYIFMQAFGGTFFDREGKVALNSPETRKAVETLVRLYRNASPEGSLSYVDRDRDSMILSGKCAMTFEPLFILSTVETKAPDLLPLFSVARPPKGPAGIGWMSEHLVISLCSGTPRGEKRLALLPYLFADEEYVRFLHHAPGGMLPVLTRTAAADGFWNHPTIQKNKDAIQIALEGYADGSPVGMSQGVTPHASFLKGVDVVKMMLYDVVKGKNVDTALADTQKKLQELIAEQK